LFVVWFVWFACLLVFCLFIRSFVFLFVCLFVCLFVFQFFNSVVENLPLLVSI
jgi:hypothetical protein